MKEYIVIAGFSVESEAYQALAEIKSDSVSDNCVILQGQIIKNENGKLEAKDGFTTGITTSDDTLKGGLIGSIVGILGGPFGVLFGGSMGALIGSGKDADDAESEASLLEKAGEKINQGETAVLLLTQEESEDILNRELGKYHTTVTRLDAAEVAAEVEHAREVQQQVAKEAREKMRTEKSEAFKKNVAKKRDEIKEKFSKLVGKNK